MKFGKDRGIRVVLFTLTFRTFRDMGLIISPKAATDSLVALPLDDRVYAG